MRQGALALAVQAVMIWRGGGWVSVEAMGWCGPFGVLVTELYDATVEALDMPTLARAVICEDLWSIIRAWPRFEALADAVDACEQRMRACQD